MGGVRVSVMKTTLVLSDFTKKMEAQIKLLDSEIRYLPHRIEEMEIMTELRKYTHL